MRLRSVLATGVVVLVAAAGLVAQSPERNPLAKVKQLRCTTSLTASATWKAGTPQAQLKEEALSVAFEKIDVDGSTAEMEAASGPIEVVALLTGSSMHFLERSFQGNLTVTSVFAPPDAKGKYRAVRSRHDYLMMAIPGFVAEPTVQQRYGECEAY